MTIELINKKDGKRLIKGDIEHMFLNYFGHKAKRLPPGEYILKASSEAKSETVILQEEISR